MRDVLLPQADPRGRDAVVDWLRRSIWALQGWAGRAVVVEHLGDRVVEDAVSGAVDRDPMAGDPGHLVIVDGAAWRAA